MTQHRGHDASHRINLLTTLGEPTAAPKSCWAVSVQNDYRLLTPWEVTDPNGNTRGVVVQSAIMGKIGDSDGDTLAEPPADPRGARVGPAGGRNRRARPQGRP